MKTMLLACVCLLGMAGVASASTEATASPEAAFTVSPFAETLSPAAGDPTAVSFVPSTDHNTQVNGAPLVIRYDAVFKKVSDGTVVSTKDCGKPALAATVSCTLPTGLPSNINLTATINTIWSGGAVPSIPSDPFVASVTAPAAAGKPTVQ